MNKFIAGVGNVTLFKGDDLILTAKTLVDTSISFSVTLEDIRAGQGAKLYGKYAHTTGMTMKLTDAMWRIEMLGANIGASPASLGGSAIATYQVTAGTNGKLDLVGANIPYGNAKPLPGSDREEYIYYAPAGESDNGWTKITKTEITNNDGEIDTAGVITEGTLVCIKFIESLSNEKTLTVRGDFIPDTLTAIVEVPVFAGDSAGSVSTKIGKVIITIPRFMLNGTMEMSMTMTGASQTAIEGSALAVTAANCLADQDYYAIISEVMDNATYWDGLKFIAIDVDGGEITVENGDKIRLSVYGIFENAIPKLLPYDSTGEKGYKITTSAGTVSASGEITVTGTGKVTVTAGDNLASDSVEFVS